MLLPETKVLTHHYTPTGILHHDPYVIFSPNIKSEFDVYPLLVLTTFHILIPLILMLTCGVIILYTKTWGNSKRLASLFSVTRLITDSTVPLKSCSQLLWCYIPKKKLIFTEHLLYQTICCLYGVASIVYLF